MSSAVAPSASPAVPSRPRRRPALERAVRTANRLFYEEGIQAVGVDRIAAEADISKATLYSHFRTKDDLVVNYLRDRSTEWQAFVRDELPKRTDDPAERILAVFDLLGDWFVTPGYRGCPFVNAEAEYGSEHPAHVVTLEHRAWVRALFVDLLRELDGSCEQSVIDFLALQIGLLYDGSMVSAQADPTRPWARAARAAAAAVLSSRSDS
ncbi:TetR/AcrR family transcriptional regulator [Frondihabitans peucedani]|uniref:TetR/AcrR family transcriptional regulator n=1 Tax=Frondihabitans peucedani TaxID=598626 RepID=A0ABP8E6P8_9MICO